MKFTCLLSTIAVLSVFNSFAQTDKPLSNIEKPNSATKHDISQNLSSLLSPAVEDNSINKEQGTIKIINPAPRQKNSASIEQTSFGTKPAAKLVAGFDGLGVGFKGPQGTATLRNPSDNSLAVGPDHIVQSVNSVMAIFTKKGKRYDSTGGVLYGPVRTANVFRGFGGPCERINNGDAVMRYDQLADRWLIIMPTFRRAALRNDSLTVKLPQPGEAVNLYQPPFTPPDTTTRRPGQGRPPRDTTGSYCMCYAVSTSSDPLGSYYRYEFRRDLFPDYPRPTVWPDGYYTTTSTGDDVIERHAYVVDRNAMLSGANATEQSFILKDVNFIINADLDGKEIPPFGAPGIMMATGGTQLKKLLGDDGIYVWKYYVDWENPSKTKLEGPVKITVAPYEYMGGGQLTKTVPQPGTEQRLDSQGDKIMARLVYRRIGDQQSIVAVHSVNTAAGGGVRWYEFRINNTGDVNLFQQGTYAPEGNYRWMASPAIDKKGNIGIGYSFGGPNDFPGQRFAGRLAKDKPGLLTLKETVLVNGEAAQTNTLRWEDYTQTAIDPDDDCTIWYVGDYLKKDAKSYSTRIGAFRMKGCK